MSRVSVINELSNGSYEMLFVGGDLDGQRKNFRNLSVTLKTRKRVRRVRGFKSLDDLMNEAVESESYHLSTIALSMDQEIVFYRHSGVSLADAIRKVFERYAREPGFDVEQHPHAFHMLSHVDESRTFKFYDAPIQEFSREQLIQLAIHMNEQITRRGQ